MPVKRWITITDSMAQLQQEIIFNHSFIKHLLILYLTFSQKTSWGSCKIFLNSIEKLHICAEHLSAAFPLQTYV